MPTSVFSRQLLQILDATGWRSKLGLAIGTDVQAYDADLAAIAALSTTSYGRALLELANQAALMALVDFATQAEMEAATATGVAVSPATVGFNPGVVKWWWYGTTSGPGTATTIVSHNVSGVSSSGAGLLTISVDTDFSGAGWAPFGMAIDGGARHVWATSISATGANFSRVRSADAAQFDGAWSVGGLGDQ